MPPWGISISLSSSKLLLMLLVKGFYDEGENASVDSESKADLRQIHGLRPTFYPSSGQNLLAAKLLIYLRHGDTAQSPHLVFENNCILCLACIVELVKEAACPLINDASPVRFELQGGQT